ncbi:acyl-CoA dehydrogenase C-terminal domain-containing protein, partial [Salmonella sp. 15E557]|nr:acyl-CoA dehydrogenase C-terminal domain-containing protein [Salmonella sp. 15E557]
ISNALAGATPYLRLFGLAAGATYLAKGALGGDNTGWTTLARFFAENLLNETSALRDRVINGAPSLLGARAALQ